MTTKKFMDQILERLRAVYCGLSKWTAMPSPKDFFVQFIFRCSTTRMALISKVGSNK
jgi:hypothetical protein